MRLPAEKVWRRTSSSVPFTYFLGCGVIDLMKSIKWICHASHFYGETPVMTTTHLQVVYLHPGASGYESLIPCIVHCDRPSQARPRVPTLRGQAGSPKLHQLPEGGESKRNMFNLHGWYRLRQKMGMRHASLESEAGTVSPLRESCMCHQRKMLFTLNKSGYVARAYTCCL